MVDQNRLLAGMLPLLAVAMMLNGAPHAFGRTHATHIAGGGTLSNFVSRVRDELAIEADIEAAQAEAQQALVSLILGGASVGPLVAAPKSARAPAAEISLPVPTD